MGLWDRMDNPMKSHGPMRWTIYDNPQIFCSEFATGLLYSSYLLGVSYLVKYRWFTGTGGPLDNSEAITLETT